MSTDRVLPLKLQAALALIHRKSPLPDHQVVDVKQIVTDITNEFVKPRATRHLQQKVKAAFSKNVIKNKPYFDERDTPEILTKKIERAASYYQAIMDLRVSVVKTLLKDSPTLINYLIPPEISGLDEPVSAVVILLIENNGYFIIENYKKTASMMEKTKDAFEIFKILLENGANISDIFDRELHTGMAGFRIPLFIYPPFVKKVLPLEPYRKSLSKRERNRNTVDINTPICYYPDAVRPTYTYYFTELIQLYIQEDDNDIYKCIMLVLPHTDTSALANCFLGKPDATSVILELLHSTWDLHTQKLLQLYNDVVKRLVILYNNTLPVSLTKTVHDLLDKMIDSFIWFITDPHDHKIHAAVYRFVYLLYDIVKSSLPNQIKAKLATLKQIDSSFNPELFLRGSDSPRGVSAIVRTRRVKTFG